MLPFLLDQPTHLVNWASPLNQGLKLWLVALPGRTGGGTWFDISGNGNHGALTNMDPATDWVGTTRRGGYGALDFDGSNDYVRASLPAITVPFTLCGWMRVSTLASIQRLAVCTATASGLSSYSIWVHVAGPTFYAQQYDGSTAGNAGSAITASTNTWYWLCGVFTSNSLRDIYIDGKFQGTNTVPVTSITANFCDIGSYENLGTRMTGQGDSIRVYNRALSASEIASLYIDECAGYPQTLNRIRRPLVFDTGGGGGGGGNRRRRLLLCGARAA